ncbi:MAG TPA: lysozyme [Mucilaginibacter sp.]|nr:lysozyme [Mucilaginibacter sp.]
MKRFLTCLSILTVLIMNASNAAINRLKSTEGFRSTAYADGMSNGVQMHSIGYGHQIQPSETNLLTMKISTDTGEALLRSDVAPIENQINSDLRVLPSQNEFDALFDFGYNCGEGALAKVISTWNTTGDKKAVTDHILMYDKTHVDGQLVVSSELQRRRKAEVALFNSPLSPSAKSALVSAGAVVGICSLAYAFLR